MRKWFDHDPERWAEYRKKYLHELSQHKEVAKEHLKKVSGTSLVLLYGAKDKEHTHARILKEYLDKFY